MKLTMGKGFGMALGAAFGVGLLAIASKAKASLQEPIWLNNSDGPGPGPGPQFGLLGIVPHGSLNSPYGPRGPEGFHAGIDIGATLGSPIRAALPGTVVDISPDGERHGYGNVVIVEHAPNLLTLYAHMLGFEPELRIGDYVQQGQVLGFVGATHAPETKPMMEHVHFEVHLGKETTPAGHIIVNPDTPQRMDPQVFLKQHGLHISDQLAQV